MACWALALPALAAEGSAAPAWDRTLERISSAVVAIRVDSTRAFDTEWNQSTQATGFVVDARRGLVLTNRHVVTPGPVRAEAVFINQEEVELKPVYRDPVHDFGFYRYDPAALRYIEPAELPLDPAAARVGLEIRVVGNDGGEQLSILSGTLARLRRAAPEYGRNRYNDFNTFYFQAASGTSGGSSGSPVIDIRGHVVALNAGAATQTASSFFLPLDRVARALALIQAGEPVGRGTLGVTFSYLPYDELRRLGLRPETERLVRGRFPGHTGMLVAGQAVPGTTGDGVLQPGDILVQAGGEYLMEFVALAALLDAAVGEPVRLVVERNGRPLEVDLVVQDLHAITPDEYLQFGDALVHRVSYQQARALNRPIEGVAVASPGYVLGAAGVPRGSVITALDGRPVRDLDDLEAVLDGLADQQRAAVRFLTADEPGASKLRPLRMDRRWFPAERCARDDEAGLWQCRPLAAGPPPLPPLAGNTRFLRHPDARVRRVASSLVQVSFQMPYTVSGVSERFYYGTGVILDTDRGYVVVDRNTVPEAMGDVRITFAGSLDIPGRVAWLHPLHNLALVAYDPALIGDTPVRPAPLGARLPQPGEPIQVIGLRGDSKLVAQGTEVASVAPLMFPLSRTMRFRDTNLETLELVSGPADIDGVIVDRRGDVVALWSSFAHQGGADLRQENRGVPAELARELLELAREGRDLRSLEVEWVQLPLSGARNLGLPEEWAERLEAHDTARRQALSVARTVAGTPAARLLEPGDLLLAIDGRPATRFREVEQLVQREIVSLQLLRDGQPINIELPTVALDGRGVDRALAWAGALLQAPTRDMAAQRAVPRVGVYVAYFSYGSPASRYGLFAGRRIVAVNDAPVMDLDEFIERVRPLRDRDSVRLTTITWNDQVEVLTLRLDKHYWPAWEILQTPEGWRRREL
jgi:S1-C subfamily serine protease